MYEVTKDTIFRLFMFFSKIWKDNSSNIGFSIKKWPLAFWFSALYDLLARGQSWKTDKSQPFCPKLTYTSPRKKCTKLRMLRFFDFSFFSNIWKDNSSKIGFSMKIDPWRFNSMCCARTAALQGENEKRMWKPCWVSCRKNTLYPKPEAKIAPRATQDPTKMEPKSTPDGPRRPLRDHLGAMFEKNLILKAPKWPLELQNEPKLWQNREKNAKKRIPKT